MEKSYLSVSAKFPDFLDNSLKNVKQILSIVGFPLNLLGLKENNLTTFFSVKRAEVIPMPADDEMAIM